MASPELQAGIIALVRSYEERIAGLGNRLGDLENRLKLNSTNSSKPPSSDPIGMKRKPPAAPSGKARGGQPGHRKARRTLVPPEKVRETFDCKPDSCRRCGHGFDGDDPEPVLRQVAELPRIERIVDESRLHRLTCPACHATTCGASPAGVPTGRFGPYLLAVLAMFAGAYRLSKRPIRQVAADVFTLPISTGMISKPERQSAAALGAPYNELAVAVHHAKATNIDEASTFFTPYSYTFCWPVSTLREPIGDGHYRKRTPAMAAGLSDHVWSMAEWIGFPVVLRSEDTTRHDRRIWIYFADLHIDEYTRSLISPI